MKDNGCGFPEEPHGGINRKLPQQASNSRPVGFSAQRIGIGIDLQRFQSSFGRANWDGFEFFERLVAVKKYRKFLLQSFL